MAEILGFLGFLFVLKLSYSKPFNSTLNYASTANIEEVIKFYNVDDKTFETDFTAPNHKKEAVMIQNRRFTLTLTVLGEVIHYNYNLESGLSNLKSCLVS